MIIQRPSAVWWLLRGMHYAMFEIRPAEMERVLREYPDMTGIPASYAIVDGEVKWWPQSMEGEFVLVMPAARSRS